MSASSLEKIEELLSDLTSDELSSLKAKITYLQRQGEQNVRTMDRSRETDIELLFNGMRRELERRGLPAPNYNYFCRTDNFRYFRDNYEHCKAYFDANFPRRRSHRQQAFAQAIRFLIDWLQSQRNPPPVTVGVLARMIQHIPAIMEHNFPGYAESGLLKPILSQGANPHE